MDPLECLREALSSRYTVVREIGGQGPVTRFQAPSADSSRYRSPARQRHAGAAPAIECGLGGTSFAIQPSGLAGIPGATFRVKSLEYGFPR